RAQAYAAASSAPFERQPALRPVAPRARIEASLATGEPGAVERHARGHARAAVGDELAFGQLRERLVPGSVRGAGDPARRIVDLVRLAAPTAPDAGVDKGQRRVCETPCDLPRVDRVATPLLRHEHGRL